MLHIRKRGLFWSVPFQFLGDTGHSPNFNTAASFFLQGLISAVVNAISSQPPQNARALQKVFLCQEDCRMLNCLAV